MRATFARRAPDLIVGYLLATILFAEAISVAYRAWRPSQAELVIPALLISATAKAHPLGVSGGYNVQPPPECAALGMTVKTYSVEANFNSGTVDFGRQFQTYASGKRVFAWNYLGGTNGADSLSNNADGSMSVFGASGPNGQASSAASIKTAPYFVGKAFVGGGCFQIIMSFDPTQIDYADNLAPAFWVMDKRHLDGQLGDQWPGQTPNPGYEYFAERDFIENYGSTAPQFRSSYGEWYGEYNTVTSTCSTVPYCKVFEHYDTTTSAVPALTDWSQWHAVTGIIVNSTSSTAGMSTTYFDHVQAITPFTWTNCPSAAPAGGPPPAAPYLGCAMDNAQFVLLWGSNAPSGLLGAIRVKSVDVWQTPAAAAQDVSN